jgi:uroporphyrinogen-III synthase
MRHATRFPIPGAAIGFPSRWYRMAKWDNDALDWSHIMERRLFDKSGNLKRVLITRPEPGASETAERVAALGLFPIVAPILSITTKHLRPPNRAAATVLTSRNAIAACPSLLHDRPLFAVGTATATQASQAGFDCVFSADGDATALVQLVADTLSPSAGPLFLPVGRGQGSDLATSLRKRGFRVFRRIAYNATGVPALPKAAAESLRLGQVTAVMFFSGETARHFVRLLQAAKLTEVARDIEAVSISERAAMALRPLPWRRISVAVKPNQDAMLALLQ